LVVAGLISVAGGALVSRYISLSKAVNRGREPQFLLSLRDDTVAVLANDLTLKKIIAENPSMACLRATGGDCSAVSVLTPLKVVLANGELYSDASTANGFDHAQLPCSGFSATTGSNDCPAQVQVSWSCASDCKNTLYQEGGIVPSRPDIRFQVRVLFRPADLSVRNSINETKADLTWTRSLEVTDQRATCAGLGGFFDQASRACNLQQKTYQCPPDFYMNGIDRKGEPICLRGATVDSACPDRNTVTGLNETGGFRCFVF
jgi:hypothetical protein